MLPLFTGTTVEEKAKTCTDIGLTKTAKKRQENLEW